MAKMTDKDKQEFDKLYQYVKKILGYGDDMALPKFMVMRLKGLSEGKFYANHKTKSMAHYDYNTIYLTFIYCKDKIQKALQTKSFTSEQNKINYIMAIVENNINDVVIRLKNAKKSKMVAQKQIEKIEIDTTPTKQLNQNGKISTDENLNSKFNNLTKEMW
jgi:hypothetical protein